MAVRVYKTIYYQNTVHGYPISLIRLNKRFQCSNVILIGKFEMSLQFEAKFDLNMESNIHTLYLFNAQIEFQQK